MCKFLRRTLMRLALQCFKICRIHSRKLCEIDREQALFVIGMFGEQDGSILHWKNDGFPFLVWKHEEILLWAVFRRRTTFTSHINGPMPIPLA